MHAVTLDLWLTLIAENPDSQGTRRRNEARSRGVLDALADAGAAVSRQAVVAGFAHSRADMDRDHRQGVDISFADRVRALVEHIAPGLSERLPATAFRRVAAAVDEPFLAYPPAPHSAADTVLNDLHMRGLRLGLISNTGFTSARAYRRWFASLGWSDLFDVTTFSNEAAMAKPTRAIFHRTVAALGVAPAHALHVGDSLRSDVAGGRAAGMATAWIAGFDDREPTVAPGYALNDLSELPQVVERWRAACC